MADYLSSRKLGRFRFINSFPCPGHHFLAQTCSLAYPQFNYCEKYKCTNEWGADLDCPGWGLPFQYNFICRAGRQVQKSHDFHLSDPILNTPGVRYVVLIRHPIPAIISWFELELREQPKLPDTAERFRGFFRSGLQFWERFVRKWVLPGADAPAFKSCARKVFSYDQLTHDVEILKEAVRFLIPEQAGRLVDMRDKDIRQFVQPPRRKIEAFRFYDQAFFNACLKEVDPAALAVMNGLRPL